MAHNNRKRSNWTKKTCNWISKQAYEPTKKRTGLPFSETTKRVYLCIYSKWKSESHIKAQVSVNFLRGFSNLWRNMIFQSHLWWSPQLWDAQPRLTHLQQAQELFQELQHSTANGRTKQQFPGAQSHTKLSWAAHSQIRILDYSKNCLQGSLHCIAICTFGGSNLVWKWVRGGGNWGGEWWKQRRK